MIKDKYLNRLVNIRSEFQGELTDVINYPDQEYSSVIVKVFCPEQLQYRFYQTETHLSEIEFMEIH